VTHRRALSHIGGAISVEGDRADADRLAHALAVPASTDDEDDPSRAHVHGFHTYPARMHPLTAARLVAAFTPPGGRVLDPFCGSGTVLAEALIAGRAATGTDLNPLAVRLAACKTRVRTPAELENLRAKAAGCAETADARRKAKAGASRRFPPSDVALFEPHVLLELDSLRVAIHALGPDAARPDLELVLSAILVKLSKKSGDTTGGRGPKRTAAGFAAKLFAQKAHDLAARLEEFGRLCPSPPPPSIVIQDDATLLQKLPPGQVSAVVTSPPYAATYDYLSHHDLRLRWLNLDASALARGEIGSRSAYARRTPDTARVAWAGELERFLRAASRPLPPGGALVIVMADSAVGEVALRADEIVAEAARACGLVPAARASQPRPHFHGPSVRAFRDRPRTEHALLLRKG
jgi:SAM-dependent methyltransferase